MPPLKNVGSGFGVIYRDQDGVVFTAASLFSP